MVSPGVIPLGRARILEDVWVGTTLELLELAVVEELTVVEELLVGGGCEVGVGAQEEVDVVGDGAGGGAEEEGAEEPPEPRTQSPSKTPRESEPKASKRPCEKSRPQFGQLSHLSVIAADNVCPPTVILIVWKQRSRLNCVASSATIKSEGWLVVPQAPRPSAK